MANRLTFTVKPHLPERLAPLAELAHDFWITWHFDAIRLFMRFGADAWQEAQQSPLRLLSELPQERLHEMEQDKAFLAHMDQVIADYHDYLQADPWYSGPRDAAVAYFSMEFGLDATLPIYSGGLGVLAGDHLKSCSDLGLPVVGVGLLYRTGYFRQRVTMDGHQLESFPANDFYNMPLMLCTSADGEPVTVTVDLGGERAHACIWRVRVGRVPLYLLDTDIEANDPSTREITGQLYVSDRRMRLRQELLLGIGGIRALRALEIPVAVTHMNEGHSAFLALERVRELMHEHGMSYFEARQAVWEHHRVHDPYAGAGRQRDLRPAPGPGPGQSAALRPGAGRARVPVAGPHRARRRRARPVRAHAARPAPGRALQRGQQAARPGVAPHVAQPVGRACRRTRCRSATSPMASICGAGSRMTSRSCWCATWGRRWPSTRPRWRCGGRWTTSPTRSCGGRTSGDANG